MKNEESSVTGSKSGKRNAKAVDPDPRGEKLLLVPLLPHIHTHPFSEILLLVNCAFNV